MVKFLILRTGYLQARIDGLLCKYDGKHQAVLQAIPGTKSILIRIHYLELEAQQWSVSGKLCRAIGKKTMEGAARFLKKKVL